MKFLTLEDLEVGMTVSIESISHIARTRILLDKKTIEEKDDGLHYGRIVFIGGREEALKGINEDDCLEVYSEYGWEWVDSFDD